MPVIVIGSVTSYKLSCESQRTYRTWFSPFYLSVMILLTSTRQMLCIFGSVLFAWSCFFLFVCWSCVLCVANFVLSVFAYIFICLFLCCFAYFASLLWVCACLLCFAYFGFFVLRTVWRCRCFISSKNCTNKYKQQLAIGFVGSVVSAIFVAVLEKPEHGTAV